MIAKEFKQKTKYGQENASKINSGKNKLNTQKLTPGGSKSPNTSSRVKTQNILPTFSFSEKSPEDKLYALKLVLQVANKLESNHRSLNINFNKALQVKKPRFGFYSPNSSFKNVTHYGPPRQYMRPMSLSFRPVSYSTPSYRLY